jgi:hypothetical protein
MTRHDDRARAVRLPEQALQLSRQVNDRLNASMFLQALAWIAADTRGRVDSSCRGTEPVGGEFPECLAGPARVPTQV